MLDRAKRDVERFTSDPNEWTRPIVMTPPGGPDYTVTGIHTKHHLSVDASYEKFVNFKNSHIAVTEKQLVDLGYPLRDANANVQLAKHQVQVPDSTGVIKKYVVDQWFPDETLGLITMILGDKA